MRYATTWTPGLTLLTLACAVSALHAAPQVSVFPSDGRLHVQIDGEPFVEYRLAGAPKPFLYPIHGPGGVPMTRSYPMREIEGEAHDHPHHRALFYAHGDVNGVDFWHEGPGAGRIVHAGVLETAGGEGAARIVTTNLWLDAAGERICTDTRTLVFRALPAARAIDFTITIAATHGPLTFGDTKEGTMAIRTHPALRLRPDPGRGVTEVSGRALNSEGDRDRELWGKRAAWVDYRGTIDGRKVGIAIFDHPHNPRHPTHWHARDYGLITANPFGIHDFEDRPAGTGDLVLPAGRTITFRYRFLFYADDPENFDIAARYQDFVQSKH